MWERGLDVCLNAPQREDVPARVAADYKVAAPVRPAAPAGMVRTAHKDTLWGNQINGVQQVHVNNLPAAPVQVNPKRISNAGW